MRYTSSEPDHDQGSHDLRLLRHSRSSPIPYRQPVQDRRAHRGHCSNSRRGSKYLLWLWSTPRNGSPQNLSTSLSHSPSNRRNAPGTVGDRRNFRHGINNALRLPGNVRVSRYRWIGRLDIFGEARRPETTARLDRGTILGTIIRGY